MTTTEFILKVVIRKVASGEDSTRSIRKAMEAADRLFEQGFLELDPKKPQEPKKEENA